MIRWCSQSDLMVFETDSLSALGMLALGFRRRFIRHVMWDPFIHKRSDRCCGYSWLGVLTLARVLYLV